MSENSWEKSKNLADRHSEGAGPWLRLANDGDKTVGVFLGDPFPREVHFVERYVTCTGASCPHCGDGKRPSLRVAINFHTGKELRVTLIESAYGKMTPQEREDLLRSLGISNASGVPGAFPFMAVQAAIGAGGFVAYQVAVIVANAVARALLGRGLSLATNAALTRALGVFAGPIGWALTAVWAAVDVASPAYRVVIPCVVQVALIRQAGLVRLCRAGHENGPSAQFCATCGAPLDQGGGGGDRNPGT